MRVFVVSICLLVAAVAIGCGDDDDDDSNGAGGNGGGGTGGVPALNCSNRCANRLSLCGAPASNTAALCNPVCAQTPTEEEVACMETTDCNELLAAFNANETKCGLQLGSAGSSGDGG